MPGCWTGRAGAAPRPPASKWWPTAPSDTWRRPRAATRPLWCRPPLTAGTPPARTTCSPAPVSPWPWSGCARQACWRCPWSCTTLPGTCRGCWPPYGPPWSAPARPGLASMWRCCVACRPCWCWWAASPSPPRTGSRCGISPNAGTSTWCGCRTWGPARSTGTTAWNRRCSSSPPGRCWGTGGSRRRHAGSPPSRPPWTGPTSGAPWSGSGYRTSSTPWAGAPPAIWTGPCC